MVGQKFPILSAQRFLTGFLGAWYWKPTGITLHRYAELLKKTGVFGLVSGELIGFVGGGYWIGGWLDEQLHTAPVFLGVLVFAGFSYSIWRIYGLSKEWMEK